MKTQREFAGFLSSIPGLGQHTGVSILEFAIQGIEPAGSRTDAPLNQASAQPLSAEIQTRHMWGPESQKERRGVHPTLLAIADRALQLCEVDIRFFDGVRSEIEQRQNVRRGVSKTMLSKHLPQADGFAHAMDLLPIDERGRPSWDWRLIYLVTRAVDEAATELGVAQHIVWGGAWDRRLSDFGGNAQAYRQECVLYSQRHPGKDFLDGPHFEWRGPLWVEAESKA